MRGIPNKQLLLTFLFLMLSALNVRILGIVPFDSFEQMHDRVSARLPELVTVPECVQ